MIDDKAIFATGYPWHKTYLWLATTTRGVCAIDFERNQSFKSFKESFSTIVIDQPNDLLANLVAQLNKYFQRIPMAFDVPLDFIRGTEFQKSVWRCVYAIPYGKTRTYGQIAKALGKPGAARAVGMANGANPIPIVVPCHRVTQSDGKLGGYSGGLDIKDALLRLEGVIF
jgi:O-6-methylguanine DNA methyltransferase